MGFKDFWGFIIFFWGFVGFFFLGFMGFIGEVYVYK